MQMTNICLSKFLSLSLFLSHLSYLKFVRKFWVKKYSFISFLGSFFFFRKLYVP